MTDELQSICEWVDEHVMPRMRVVGRGHGCTVYKGIDATYLLTGNGALELVEAMRERGWSFEGYRDERNSGWRFYTTGDGPRSWPPFVEKPAPLPEAIVRAAYAAEHG